MTEGPGDREPPGLWLRRQRRAAGLTQEELASRSELSVRTISNLERDRTQKPHPRSVRRVTGALGLAEMTGSDLITRYRASQDAGSGLPQRSDADTPGSRASPDLEQEQAESTPAFIPRQLPAATRHFVGRQAELESLARTTLLGAVSHDLRTPLAAAKAAVSCLRSRSSG